MKELSRLGVESHSADERSEIARRAALARWNNIPLAVHIDQCDRQAANLEVRQLEALENNNPDLFIRLSLTILAWERHRLTLEAREPRRVEQFEERTETTAEQASKVSQMTTEELRAMVEGKGKAEEKPATSVPQRPKPRKREAKMSTKNDHEHTALKVKPVPLTPEIMRDDDES